MKAGADFRKIGRRLLRSPAMVPVSSTSTRTSPLRTAATAAPRTVTRSPRSCSACRQRSPPGRVRLVGIDPGEYLHATTPAASLRMTGASVRSSRSTTVFASSTKPACREENNNFTVGFDPTVTNALSSVVIPADPLAGTPARNVAGGLMYAGVNGNPTTRATRPRSSGRRALGAAYSIDRQDGHSRRVRPVLGAAATTRAVSSASNNYGQVGFSQNTILTSSRPATRRALTNPFPTRPRAADRQQRSAP